MICTSCGLPTTQPHKQYSNERIYTAITNGFAFEALRIEIKGNTCILTICGQNERVRAKFLRTQRISSF